MTKMTTEEFIAKAREVHGDKYDYSKVEYINSQTKVCIICPEHGEFFTRPNNHLRGRGCPGCNRPNYRITTEEFIAKAREIHGDKYDYSKASFKTMQDKVCIICPEHGEFWQAPSNHLKGCGCPKCGNDKIGEKLRIGNEDFIAKAREVHGDKYDYSKVEYVNGRTKVCIICPEHGEFWTTPSQHLKGSACPKCCGREKMTTELFIKKAREVHGDKYDYSKVDYKNTDTKVCIICPEHGEFLQTPYSHLKGAGCEKCLRPNANMTTDEFITKAREVHGDKYDYSNVEYVNATTKVSIICPEHGEFWQIPGNHLKGMGCKKCKGLTRLSTEEFISKAREVHGDKYDYSKVDYKNNSTKVCIICPEHGEFWQAPSNHLLGNGCPKCSGVYHMNQEDFIAKAREVHGDKYDYSKVVFRGSKTKVCIICPEHGEFWQLAQSHLRGHGCPKCMSPNWGMDTESFIAAARKVHGDKYDYSKVKYVNSDSKVCIICPEHGEFWQNAYYHLRGVGCPNCYGLRKDFKFNLLQEFENEYAFRAFLANNDINILQVILRNVEPKYEPLKKDIEKALANAESMNPIRALEEKYSSDNADEEEPIDNEPTTREEPIQNTPDLDDDDAMSDFINTMSGNNEQEEKEEPTIEEITRNREEELKVINRIEHMLTPEDREYIMNKFLNDKRRDWMANREQNK